MVAAKIQTILTVIFIMPQNVVNMVESIRHAEFSQGHRIFYKLVRGGWISLIFTFPSSEMPLNPTEMGTIHPFPFLE